jgi:hypothetical protein
MFLLVCRIKRERKTGEMWGKNQIKIAWCLLSHVFGVLRCWRAHSPISPLHCRNESELGESAVSEGLMSALSISRLGARVQHGLTPMKLALSIWFGSLAPKVMLNWLSISWCLRFCSVRGRWLGCIFLFFLFRLDSFSGSSFSRRPKVKLLANLLLLLVVDLCSEDVSLVVVVVVLLSVCEMVSELSDLRRARRNRSRMAIVGVHCGFRICTAREKSDWQLCCSV